MSINKNGWSYVLLLLAALMAGSGLTQAQVGLNSMAGVRVGITKSEVQRLSGKPIHIKDDITPVPVSIDGVPFSIIFHTFRDSVSHVYRISTTSPKFRTTEGVGVGSSIDTVWNAYKGKRYLIRNKYFYDFSDLDTKSQYAFSIYIPSMPDNGYDDQVNFYFDGQSGKVIEVSLRHGEDWP